VNGRLNKCITLCLVISFGIFSGCTKGLSTSEQIKSQIPMSVAVIGLDEKIYIEASKEQPNHLTKKVYDGTVAKAMLLQRLEFDSGEGYELEKDVKVQSINSLCLMANFILLDSYRIPYQAQVNSYSDFYSWLSKKQLKWKMLSSKEKDIIDRPCK
jgi:hypothetical protein